MSKLEKITFRPEGEEPVEFYVLEQTRIGGRRCPDPEGYVSGW